MNRTSKTRATLEETWVGLLHLVATLAREAIVAAIVDNSVFNMSIKQVGV